MGLWEVTVQKLYEVETTLQAMLLAAKTLSLRRSSEIKPDALYKGFISLMNQHF